MIECIWIRIKDGADPMDVLQRAQDAMGKDGLIIALKPEDEDIAAEIHNDPELMKLVERGMKAREEGKVKPWSKIKKELGL